MKAQRIFLHLFLSLVALVSGQSSGDGLTICRRYGQQTTILDGRLYIDGGWVYTDPNGIQSKPATPNRNLIYSDLSRVTGNMPTQFALQKDATVPSVAGGVLWADAVNKVFWQFGGEFANPSNAVDFELWGYDTYLNKWNISTPQPGSQTVSRVSYGAGTAVDGTGYYYGGYLSNLTVPNWSGPPIATSSLIKFDMDGATFSNETNPDNIGRAEGVMISIPNSIKGMLVYFGGIQFPYVSSPGQPMPMSQILLYDINEKRWFTQTATGDIPPNRRRFCAGAAWAQDQSSFNIYLYGGSGFGVNATGFDDVYILSLPTFTWIKWFPTESNYDPARKSDLTCNVVRGAEMLIIGGNYTESNACDSAADAGAQHNLNLGQNNVAGSKWDDYRTNLTSYIVPPAVIQVAGGNANGGATNVKPASGSFVDARLDTYFSQTARAVTRTPTRSLPAATSSAAPGTKPPIGAIAGGAVGGVVVLAAAIFAIWWFCLRKKPRAASPPPQRNVGELVGDSRLDMKTAAVGSPSSVNSGSATPYSTPPPINYPPYAYPYPPPQMYPVPMQQVYGYPQPMYIPTSPPEGMYPQQAYFPPPEQRAHGMYEMPISRTPGVQHVSSPTSHHGSTSHDGSELEGNARFGSPTHRSY